MTKESLQRLSVNLPASLLRDIEMIALGAGQPSDAVVRRALELYLSSEGRDLLAVIDGRRQLDEGLHEDLDDVIADIDRIVAGNAA
jgi:predicted transcriptional regulator